jgi:hypothetical protein
VKRTIIALPLAVLLLIAGIAVGRASVDGTDSEQPTTVAQPAPLAAQPAPQAAQPDGDTQLSDAEASTTAPSPVPNSSEDFVVSFDGNVGLDRFDYGLWHRDDHLVSYQSWTGDHDTNCGSPDTQRPIRRDRWQDSFYMCKDHMMTSVGETSGYSLAWFTPKQSFTDETKVSWDVNVTDLGGRQWWEVMIYPESDGDRYSIAAESVDGTECLVCTTEDWIAKTANILPYGPGSIVVGTGPAALEDPHIHFDGGENLYTGGTKICSAGKATWFRDSGACDSKKTRLTFSMTDNQNGTITVNYGGAFTQTITGSFPNEPWRVVFKDHNYTPDKDGTPIGHTWHWDNIIVR